MARKANKDDPEARISNTFEELIEKGKIKFKKVKLIDLPNEWAKTVVHSLLEQSKLKWALGNKQIDGSICIKVEDEYLQYIDIYYPSQMFMWCTKEHHEGVHPDIALSYMLNKRSNISKAQKPRR